MGALEARPPGCAPGTTARPEHLAQVERGSPRRVPGTQASGPCTLGEATSWAILWRRAQLRSACPRRGGQPPVSASPQRFFHTRLREKGSSGRRPHGRSGPRPGPVSRPPLAPQAVRAWQSLWPAPPTLCTPQPLRQPESSARPC